MEDRFCEKCDYELAEYEYKGQGFCSNCLLEELQEEKEIDVYCVETYYLNGEYIGDDNDLGDVIEKLQCSIDIKDVEG